MLKAIVKKIPVLRDLARGTMKLVAATGQKSFNSSSYWEDRYKSGGSSGAGSYNRLAEFKAEIINRFVEHEKVTTVLEFGCGDGAQLALANYPDYTGVDVSPTVLDRAKQRYSGDLTKRFVLVEQAKGLSADLSISLDVVYHLVEDAVFDKYMRDLFQAADRFVIIYSSNDDSQSDAVHVRHRKFTDWIEKNARAFSMIKTVLNRYPFDPANPDHTSFADLFIFQRNAT